VTGADFSEVDIDLLADYVGGALDGTPDEATVAALISDNPAWQAGYAAMVDASAFVGAQLGTLGTPAEPMPAEISDRLERLLLSADANPVNVTAAHSDVADPSSIEPELAAPSGPRLEPVGEGAASGRHLSAVRNDDLDRAAGERGRATAAGRRRRLRWAAPIAVAAGALAFVGFGINYLSGGAADSQDNSTAGASAARPENALADVVAAPTVDQILASGVDYQRTTLQQNVLRTLAGPDAPGPTGLSSKKATAAPPAFATDAAGDALARLRPREALLACLDAIAVENGGGAITVQTVDYARFEGRPAVVVRFSADNGEWAWASGPECGNGAAGAATQGRVPVG
jgi:hypothetical protein